MGDGAQLTISIGDGGIQVTGPLDNPLLCFGMLEMARAQITGLVLGAKQAEAAPRKIMTVDGIVADRLRNPNGR